MRPGEIGVDSRDVGCADAGVFGVAPVDRSTETAHQRRHRGTDRELATGAGVDDADALDTADFGCFGPLAAAHVHFGVIDAERAYRDHDFADAGVGFRDFGVRETVQAAETLEHDRPHQVSAGRLANDRRGRG
jgi:hypothetical protein